MDLICGTVKAKGKKEDLLTMFEALEDYYDKNIISQKGTSNNYTIEFEFSSKISSFLSYGDYFQSYSEGYDCTIKAELQAEEAEDEEPMILEYKKGEIIKGVEEYGIESDF